MRLVVSCRFGGVVVELLIRFFEWKLVVEFIDWCVWGGGVVFGFKRVK